MKIETEGMNRTGIATAPELAAELLEGSAEAADATNEAGAPLEVEGELEAGGLAGVRLAYAREAEPTGARPDVTGAEARGAAAESGAEDGALRLFADKLGERLVFERAGVRLYEALLPKLEAFGSWRGGPTREELERVRDEELEHFLLLTAAIEATGGDPTALTPSANLHAVAAKGLPAVLSDPRTDVGESLEALLVAELVDNDGWSTLVDLARAVGQEELATAFEQALDEERDHLALVRGWLTARLGAAVGRDLPPATGAAPPPRAAAGAAKPRAKAAAKRASKATSRATTKGKTKRAAKTATKGAAKRATKPPAGRAGAPAKGRAAAGRKGVAAKAPGRGAAQGRTKQASRRGAKAR